MICVCLLSYMNVAVDWRPMLLSKKINIKLSVWYTPNQEKFNEFPERIIKEFNSIIKLSLPMNHQICQSLLLPAFYTIQLLFNSNTLINRSQSARVKPSKTDHNLATKQHY